MLKNIQNILLLIMAIIIGILLLQNGCGRKEPVLSPKTDTLTTHDTVWAYDTIIAFKPIIEPKIDTIYKIDTLKYDIDPLDLFLVREYNDSITDTNQTLYYHARTLGMLDSLSIKYKLKIPVKINTTNTITKIIPVAVDPKFTIYGGLETGGSKNSFNISPFINLNIKNNNIYYRYGVLDNTHNIGVGIKLFKSKKYAQ